MENDKKLNLVFGNQTLAISGTDYRYIFHFNQGGPISLNIHGKEWLYQAPRPTFWRATTDNDRGNSFSKKSAMWLGADLFSTCSNCSVVIDGNKIEVPAVPIDRYPEHKRAEQVEFTYTFDTDTIPATNVTVKYKIDNSGQITVKCKYEGNDKLPDLPCFGLRLITPTAATGYQYFGLEGETYPDRLGSEKEDIFEINGLPVTPYLVPQESGMHIKTHSLTVTRNTTQANEDKSATPFHLSVRQTREPFSFSCLPYTAEELENANHMEELPPVRRTVLCIFGKVRGVGGIDSWGSDVEPTYRIDATKDHSFEFVLMNY